MEKTKSVGQLSDLIKEIPEKRIPLFLKKFKQAIVDGVVAAAEGKERFDYRVINQRSGKVEEKSNIDMFYRKTDQFAQWFKETKETLEKMPSAKPKLTKEAIEAGIIDFDALARETREKLSRKIEAGRRLGKNRTAKN